VVIAFDTAINRALITLVNRPVEQLLRHLYPGQRLVVFSEDGSTPATVARLLTEYGYGSSKIDVFENLGGSSERKPGTGGMLAERAMRQAESHRGTLRSRHDGQVAVPCSGFNGGYL
jgi:precorrin-6B methylase 1